MGLVRDAAYSSVRQPPPPQFFLPHRQAEPRAASYFFYVRSAGDPRPLIEAIPTLVQRLAPAVPVVGLRTVGDQIARQMAGDRLAATFTTVFAALATLLAGIGLYAVLAYAVARRRREIGVRIALGATAGTIRRSVLAQVSRIVVTGLVLGVAGAVALGRAGSAFLVGLDGGDPRVLAGAAGVVILVALAAAIIPARRAVSVNPVEAIRAE